MKLRTLLVNASAGALVLAGPGASALAAPGDLVLAASHDDDNDHSHDDDHGHDDGHGHSHDDDEDADVMPSSVDAGSGGLSTDGLPAWVFGLMALGAAGIAGPVTAAARRR